jgi:hypothetical protein
MQGAVRRAGMEGAMRKSRNGGSSKEWCKMQGPVRKEEMEGAQGKSRNGRSSEEEQEWREQ